MAITKNILKAHIIKNIQQHAPDRLNMIEKKRWSDIWHYVQGYEDALSDLSTPPINKKEANDLLLEVGSKFFFKKFL